MTSSVCDRPVSVHVLYMQKLHNQEIWTPEVSTTEATITHSDAKAYTLEISDCESSDIVVSIDFRKIKSYIMRAKCWHEVAFEDRKVCLRFQEDDKTFEVFYAVLENVLRAHKKYTKPKNDKKFLDEIKKFDVSCLKPVSVRREGSDGSQDKKKSSISGIPKLFGFPGRKSTNQSPKSSAGTSESSDEVIRGPKKTSAGKLPPKIAEERPVNSLCKKPSRPLPEVPTSTPVSSSSPPRTPPPRQARIVYENVNPAPVGLSDTSDEELEKASKVEYAGGDIYSDFEEDFEVFVPDQNKRPPVADKRRPKQDVEERIGLDERGNSRPKPSRTISQENANAPEPPVVRKNQLRQQNSEPVFSPPCPLPRRQERGGTLPATPAGVPRQPGVRRKDPENQQPLSPTVDEEIDRDQRVQRVKLPAIPKERHGEAQCNFTPSAGGRQVPGQLKKLPPAPPRSKPSPNPPTSPRNYGNAPTWRCEICTLFNAANRSHCEACEYERKDAWKCNRCTTVNSNDVQWCVSCPTWRCRLCTFQNEIHEDESAPCTTCGQR